MRWLAVIAFAACTPPPPKVPLVETCPNATDGNYWTVARRWTRSATLRGQYQEVLDLDATLKSPEWRLAHAVDEADARRLEGEARQQKLAQACTDVQGPYEIELLVTTWDRRENDLDRGKRSVWRVVLIDPAGHEIEPLEIVKDKRPPFVVRSEFPALGDFATAYIARFPRTTPLLGPDIKAMRLRMSGERGGVELDWEAP
jgi:hypothetical protein